MNNSERDSIPDKPWQLSADEVVEKMDVDPEQGLSQNEAGSRLSQYGRNVLRETGKKGIIEIIIDQFRSLVMGLLAAAGILSFVFGDWIEGVAIVAAMLVNGLIGFITEIKAVRSMESLRQMSSISAVVKRDGQASEIDASELVPGDIVLIEGGDMVTADMRLIEASKMQADESALTGESLPVGKNIEAVDEDAPLADRSNMLYKGTAVTRGSGMGVAVNTGMKTELGEISTLVEEAEKGTTPLEKRLDKLARKLVWAVIILTVVIALLGILRGKEVLLMIETAIALAVAAIPEGLPIVATIALARGMMRMAKRNALINRLASVETLGATNIICTDKTGTLTENRMTVTNIRLHAGMLEVPSESDEDFRLDDEKIDPQENEAVHKALLISVLCNNASLPEGDDKKSRPVGDPLEVALLQGAAKAGFNRRELIKKMPEEREEAFDSDVKMMATYNRDEDGLFVAVKGAPEAVFEACGRYLSNDGEKDLDGSGREEWKEYNQEMAADGLRVLALAYKRASDTKEEPYENLVLAGLIGMLDPPREGVRDSIDTCQAAGIKVIMVTGDQPVTARKIAMSVGLTDSLDVEVIGSRDLGPAEELDEGEKERLRKAPIFARVSPRQKLDIISIHQEHGSVVAMTGDGVNDAPALKKADIGIAMGERGTQVAKEAADMVLKDDAFSSIVAAVEHGRVIFNNIREFVLYLFSCNVSGILAIASAALANLPLPMLPLQILFLNLVTDVFPALALGLGEGDPDIMKRPAREPDEPILDFPQWYFIAAFGAIIAVVVIGAFSIAYFWLDFETNHAITISFLTMAFARIWHVFNMRDTGSDFLVNDVTKNKYIWQAVIISIGLVLAAVYLPGLSHALKTVSPGLTGWLIILGMSLIPWIIGQIFRTYTKYKVNV